MYKITGSWDSRASVCTGVHVLYVCDVGRGYYNQLGVSGSWVERQGRRKVGSDSV